MIVGGGYIGSALAKHLVTVGSTVRVVSREFKPIPGAETIQLEVGATSKMRELKNNLSAPTIFYMLGGAVGYNHVREMASLGAVLNALDQSVVKLFVIASTVLVYGNNHEPTGETAKPCPVTSYAQSKLDQEQLLEDTVRNRNNGLKGVAARISNTYGGLGNKGLIGNLVDLVKHGCPRFDVYANGQIVKDYIYIDNVILALMGIVGRAFVQFDTVNIASGKSHTTLEIIEQLNKLLKNKIETRLLPDSHSQVGPKTVSIRKLAETYRYRPETSLRQGLEQTLKANGLGEDAFDL